MKANFLFVLVVLATAYTATTVRANTMYWADNGNIFKANLDGTGVEQIFTKSNVDGQAGWIDVDFDAEKLYWRGLADLNSPPNGTGVVRRMNLDGTGLEDVLTGLNFDAYGFALDVPAGKMYFGDHGQGIFTANLDGSGKALLPGTDGLRHTHDIVVSQALSQVYYSNAEHTQFNGFNGVRRADLDGSNIEDVFNNNGVSVVAVYMALDEAAGNIYWSIEPTGEIFRADLDGSNPTLLLSGITGVRDIEIDPYAGKLYWTSQHVLQRANLDGTQIEDLVPLSGVRSIQGLVLDVIVPEPSVCPLVLFVFLTLAGRRMKKGSELFFAPARAFR